ncbi:MAG: RNA-binding protein [Candidatus Thorarchaeota archaeon]|nr:RNA-binding protein [Candidatus Thorarchaeota archaeon]
MAVYFKKREVVVPGELLAEGRYRSSMGTYDEDGKVYSALLGIAELRGNTVKVVPLEGVYIPSEGDLVIGTITRVAGNNWKVDITGPYGASLHANNALRRPYDDDISRYFDIGDVIAAEITAFDRNSGPFLTLKGRGLGLLTEGMLLDLSPAKIPRVIGRSGSMISMIKDKLRIEAVVAQNGRIWIRAPDSPTLNLAIKAFKMIEAQAHTSKLTERIGAMLDQEMADMKEKAPKTAEVEEEARAPVEAESPEEEPEPLVEEESAEDAITAPTEEPAEPKASEEELAPAEEAEVAKDNDNTTEEVTEE